MQKIVRYALILALCAASACSSGSPVKFPPLSFKKYPPIHVAVSNIEFVEEYKSTRASPYVEHLMPYSPAEAMQIWVRDRLVAVGSENTLKVIIKDGSVKVTQIADGITLGSLFSIGIEKRYDATLDVEMRVYADRPIAEADLRVKATRSLELPENSSAWEREEAFRRIINEMMVQVNAELEKNIFQHMGNFISFSQNP